MEINWTFWIAVLIPAAVIGYLFYAANKLQGD